MDSGNVDEHLSLSPAMPAAKDPFPIYVYPCPVFIGFAILPLSSHKQHNLQPVPMRLTQ